MIFLKKFKKFLNWKRKTLFLLFRLLKLKIDWKMIAFFKIKNILLLKNRQTQKKKWTENSEKIIPNTVSFSFFIIILTKNLFA